MGAETRTPLLADLREPPEVGRFYLVPIVRYRLRGLMADWPVLGPPHHDRGRLNFPWVHYHLDGRFLNARQYAHMGRQVWPRGAHNRALNGLPLMAPSDGPDDLPRKPRLARRLCQRSIQRWVVQDLVAPHWKLQETYGEDVEAIRLADGRLLCPHRKADLSSFPVDADGIVTCPLHGLRVCVGKAAAGCLLDDVQHDGFPTLAVAPGAVA